MTVLVDSAAVDIRAHSVLRLATCRKLRGRGVGRQEEWRGAEGRGREVTVCRSDELT